jgi:hypothetical protein
MSHSSVMVELHCGLRGLNRRDTLDGLSAS